MCVRQRFNRSSKSSSNREHGSIQTNTTFTDSCQSGDTNTNRSVTVTANTHGTRTVMVSMRFMSTQWRGSGRYYEVGYVLIAAFHRNVCRFMSVFFSWFTMSANAETRYSGPWSKHSSASIRNRLEPKVFSNRFKYIIRAKFACYILPWILEWSPKNGSVTCFSLILQPQIASFSNFKLS